MEQWPDWFEEYRPHQGPAIDAISEAFQAGIRLVILDAPTGSGKTLIAEAVRRQLDTRALYVCTQKTLQEQVRHDYPYADVLMGRANYQPLEPKMGATCADCTKHRDDDGKFSCQWCPVVWQCPYEKAKSQALSSSLAVTNTRYWLTEANGPAKFSGFPFVIIDECDTLEQEVMSYAGFEVTSAQSRRWDLAPPKRVTVESAWRDWAVDALPHLERELSSRDGGADDVRAVRERLQLKRARDKVRALVRDLAAGGWVYTGRGERIEFKPVEVRELGGELIWKHAPRFLLMSATVISPEELVSSLGWEGEWHHVGLGSTFPVENRPIRVAGITDMSGKARDEGGWEKMGDAVACVVARHPTDRVLVHTVSYDLARVLLDRARLDGRPTTSYSSPLGRQEALRSWRQSRGGVLFAPSQDRGLDLPDDACRVVIVAKVPYPYLGDRQVSARLYSTRDGQSWYTTQTARTLVQMTGRHVRHDMDKGVTYILDSAFGGRLWHKARRILPQWWKDALVWNWQL